MGVPVFEISKDFVFSAAHQIRMHGGKCERLHGHNWRIRVHARASRLNRIGMVVDFADLQKIVAELCARFDHRNVNEIPPFDEVNTTAELLARYFYAPRQPGSSPRWTRDGSWSRRWRSGRTRGRWRCTGRSERLAPGLGDVGRRLRCDTSPSARARRQLELRPERPRQDVDGLQGRVAPPALDPADLGVLHARLGRELPLGEPAARAHQDEFGGQLEMRLEGLRLGEGLRPLVAGLRLGEPETGSDAASRGLDAVVPASSEAEVGRLRAELEKAVAEEDYERAAAIRDKLRELDE